MNETDDSGDELTAAYDGLRSSVGHTVEVESGLSALHSSTGTSGSRNPSTGSSDSGRSGVRRPWVVAAMATTAAAVLAVALVVGTGSGPQPVESGPAPERPSQPPSDPVPAPAVDERCDELRIQVFIDFDAPPEMIQAVQAQLPVVDPEGEWLYLDHEASHQQLAQDFPDQPDLLAALRPEYLPTSFRRVVDGDLDSIDLAAINAIPAAMPGAIRGAAPGTGPVDVLAPPAYVLGICRIQAERVVSETPAPPTAADTDTSAPDTSVIDTTVPDSAAPDPAAGD